MLDNITVVTDKEKDWWIGQLHGGNKENCRWLQQVSNNGDENWSAKTKNSRS